MQFACNFFMKYFISIVLLIFAINGSAQSNPENKTDLNTVYVCIDSTSYDRLFQDLFIKDSLFICREQHAKTNDDSYNAKYFIGESATVEFFKPNNTGRFGDGFGDCGIEFKTRQLGALDNLEIVALKNNFVIDTATTKFYTDSINHIAWYKTIRFKSHRNELTLQEYQSDYLSYLGFSENEIKKPMVYKDFNSKLANGKKYPRQFSKINYIKLYADKKLLAHLKQFAKLNKLKESKHKFTNSELTIEYILIKDLPQFSIQEIRIALLNPVRHKTVDISKNLVIEIENNEAKIKFNYQEI